jgi:hypothetical protein
MNSLSRPSPGFPARGWLTPLSLPLRRAACAALLCVATAVQAQSAPGDGDLAGVLHAPAWRTYVIEGLVHRDMAMELTRRVLLLNRCTVYSENRSFPHQPAPKLAAVVDTGWRWAVRGGVDGTPGDRTMFFAQRHMGIVLNAMFSSAELRDWERFRASRRGARGLAVNALSLGISQVAETGLADATTGVPVGWPLATLRHMADELHLRAEFDAALDELSPGTSAQVGQFSEILGEGPQPDERLAALTESVADGEYRFTAAFLKHLNPGDKAALRALENQPLWRRWEKGQENYRKRGDDKPFLPFTPEMSTKALCEAMAAPRCQPAVRDALERNRKEWEDYAWSSALRDMRNFLRQMPEAGCPPS